MRIVFDKNVPIGAVTPRMSLRFEQAFGGSADMWLRMQVAYDLAQARNHQGKLRVPRLEEHTLPETAQRP